MFVCVCMCVNTVICEIKSSPHPQIPFLPLSYSDAIRVKIFGRHE